MAGKAVLFLVLCALVHVSVAVNKLPNIGYMGYGYNVYYGNPQDTQQFDPGFGKAPIFEFTYNQQQTTPDGNWEVPDNVAVPGAATECNVQGSSTTIQYASQYQSSLSVDASVDMSGYGAAFTASADYKQVEQSTQSQSNVFVSTSATCETYLVDINAYVHPNFSDTFVQHATALPLYYDSNNASAFWQFFNLVGTHFPTQIIFGSRWGYSFQSTTSQWTTMQNMGIDVSVAASYAGLIKAGVQVNTQYAQQMASNFSAMTSSTYEFSLGLAPPASGSTSDWLTQSLSSNEMDPLQYTLSNITELFTLDYTNDVQLLKRFSAVNAALGDYCNVYLLSQGALETCSLPPPPPPPTPPMGFGALACLNENGDWDCVDQFGAVFDGLNAIQAQEVALDFCPGCQIAASVSDGECLALAVGSNGVFAVVWDNDNQTIIVDGAIQECEQNGGTDCEIWATGCATPPPAGATWGAISCVNNCDSFYTTTTGYPDRIEAHQVAMDHLQGSWIAIDYDQCGAIAKGSNGFASAGAATPQDAINAAIQECESGLQNCQILTYGCVDSSSAAQRTKEFDSKPKVICFVSKTHKQSKFQIN